jgi:predicted ATP-grasp superfamily ATP-dependent carboligase
LPAGVWLHKRGASSGARHVRPYRQPGARIPAGTYLQEEVFGDSLAVNFLAGGGTALMVGWIRHFRSGMGEPWLADGCCAIPPPPGAIRDQMVTAVERLARTLGLRGLGGADFVIDGRGRALLVDLNARPTASCELHDHGGSLFAAQLHGDGGLSPRQDGRPAAAFATVFSRSDRDYGRRRWPPWVSDIPCGAVAAGAPLCTVYARALEPDEAIRRVSRRARRVMARVGL